MKYTAHSLALVSLMSLSACHLDWSSFGAGPGWNRPPSLECVPPRIF